MKNIVIHWFKYFGVILLSLLTLATVVVAPPYILHLKFGDSWITVGIDLIYIISLIGAFSLLSQYKPPKKTNFDIEKEIEEKKDELSKSKELIKLEEELKRIEAELERIKN